MTRWIAPGGAVLGSLLLCGCSAVGTPEPACRPLEVAEFPLLGGIRGTWMDDERFVLADLHQSRLLVYSTSEGLVRIVNGWESEDLELNFVSPADIQPWEDGYVLADGLYGPGSPPWIGRGSSTGPGALGERHREREREVERQRGLRPLLDGCASGPALRTGESTHRREPVGEGVCGVRGSASAEQTGRSARGAGRLAWLRG